VANVGGERPASEIAESTGLIGVVARTGDARGSDVRG